MNLQTVEQEEGGNEQLEGEKAFEKYFNDKDLFELFRFEDSKQCATLDLILKKDGFKYV